MLMVNSVWLHKAISLVMDGSVDKAVKDNITIYRVKDIVRIDIKDANSKDDK